MIIILIIIMNTLGRSTNRFEKFCKNILRLNGSCAALVPRCCPHGGLGPPIRTFRDFRIHNRESDGSGVEVVDWLLVPLAVAHQRA